MTENAAVFLSYEGIQNLVRYTSHRSPQEKLPLYHLTLAAAGAGAITSFLQCVLFIGFAEVPSFFSHRTFMPVEHQSSL